MLRIRSAMVTGHVAPHAGARVEILSTVDIKRVNWSPPCGGVSRNNKAGSKANGMTLVAPHAGATRTERKKDDQSSLLPTKNFHPRISVNTRPSGIFLTE